MHIVRLSVHKGLHVDAHGFLGRLRLGQACLSWVIPSTLPAGVTKLALLPKRARALGVKLGTYV